MNLLARLYPIKLWYWRLFRPITIGVRAVPVDPDGRLLLLRHTYVRGWYFPGGGVEVSETLAAAAAREMQEEVGLQAIGAPTLITAQTFFIQGRTDHVVLFRIAVDGSAPRVDGWEIAEARYFEPDNLPPLPSVTQRQLGAFNDMDRPESDPREP